MASAEDVEEFVVGIRRVAFGRRTVREHRDAGEGHRARRQDGLEWSERGERF